jgi:hypothetical protein
MFAGMEAAERRNCAVYLAGDFMRHLPNFQLPEVTHK